MYLTLNLLLLSIGFYDSFYVKQEIVYYVLIILGFLFLFFGNQIMVITAINMVFPLMVLL